jgi:hypothetical protein
VKAGRLVDDQIMRAILSIFVTACLLAACGGGGQDNPDQPSILIHRAIGGGRLSRRGQ